MRVDFIIVYDINFNVNENLLIGIYYELHNKQSIHMYNALPFAIFSRVLGREWGKRNP